MANIEIQRLLERHGMIQLPVHQSNDIHRAKCFQLLCIMPERGIYFIIISFKLIPGNLSCCDYDSFQVQKVSVQQKPCTTLMIQRRTFQKVFWSRVPCRLVDPCLWCYACFHALFSGQVCHPMWSEWREAYICQEQWCTSTNNSPQHDVLVHSVKKKDFEVSGNGFK